MKVDYSKGKIYKITNDYNDDVFVGFTCDTLIKKFSKHKSDSNSKGKMNKPLYELINKIGFGRFRIQLICDFPCEDRYQLCQKTCECIRLYGKNLNLNGQEQAELKKIRKEENNRQEEEKIRQEKEKIRKEQENIKKRGEKVYCDCGYIYYKYDMNRHLKSKNHLKLIETKPPQNTVIE
jgi:hypothetical protein